MSREDIINQYDIFPIVSVLLVRKLVREMMQSFTRPSKRQLTDSGELLKRSIADMWKKNNTFLHKYKS